MNENTQGKFIQEVVTHDGVDYEIIFNFVGLITIAYVIWNSGLNPQYGKAGTPGVAKCHPNDKYDQKIGMRQALRRACGLNYPTYARVEHKLEDVYRKWRSLHPLPESVEVMEKNHQKLVGCTHTRAEIASILERMSAD